MTRLVPSASVATQSAAETAVPAHARNASPASTTRIGPLTERQPLIARQAGLFLVGNRHCPLHEGHNGRSRRRPETSRGPNSSDRRYYAAVETERRSATRLGVVDCLGSSAYGGGSPWRNSGTWDGGNTP